MIGNFCNWRNDRNLWHRVNNGAYTKPEQAPTLSLSFNIQRYWHCLTVNSDATISGVATINDLNVTTNADTATLATSAGATIGTTLE